MGSAKGKKKNSAVMAAEAMVTVKDKELSDANAAVARIEAERRDAITALREAQKNADAELPQCRLVRVKWRSGEEEGGARVVILRRTPGGMLVVRHVGDANGPEYKFKWSEHSGAFRQAEKVYGYGSGHRELRDVPKDFLP